MSSIVRVNTTELCGDILRKIQADYSAKFKPAKISLQDATNLCIEHGENLVRQKLNLETEGHNGSGLTTKSSHEPSKRLH